MVDTIYTHDEATRIVELFDELLGRHGIKIPSPEDNQREEDNAAALYGSCYSELLDEVETILCDIAAKVQEGYEVLPYVYSGTC